MAAMASLEDTCTAANLRLFIGRQINDGSLARSDWLDDYLDPGPDLAHAGRNLGPSVTGQQPGSGVVLCIVLDTCESGGQVSARGSESRARNQ